MTQLGKMGSFGARYGQGLDGELRSRSLGPVGEVAAVDFLGLNWQVSARCAGIGELAAALGAAEFATIPLRFFSGRSRRGG